MKTPLHALLLAVSCSFTFFQAAIADGPTPPPLIQIASGLPGKQVRLTWPAVAGTRYRIEKSATLDSWKQVALVEATGPEGTWLDPERTTTKSFYRVAQPVPEVFSISPPLLSRSGGLLVVEGQSIPAGSFLVLNVDGQTIFVPLTPAGGMWESTVIGQFIEDSSVIATGIVNGAGTTIVTLNVPITVTATGRALDAPPSLPPGAPVLQAQSNPISGIGIPIKRGPFGSPRRVGSHKKFPPSLFAHNIMQRSSWNSNGPLYSGGHGPGSNPLHENSARLANNKHPDLMKLKEDPFAPAARGRILPTTPFESASSSLIASWMSKKGYEYYKNMGEITSANRVGLRRHFTTSDDGTLVLVHRGSKTSEAKNTLGAIARALPGEVHIPLSALSLACPAGPDIDFSCTYRSMAPIRSGLGSGWDFSYNIFIEPLPAGTAATATRVAIHDGQGRRDVFHRQPDGSFTCSGMFRVGRFDGETFTLTFADTGKWVFRPLGGRLAQGKIATITDRNGVSLACDYEGTGQLGSVSSQFGQSITLAYTGDLISSVTDHTGRSVNFSHYAASDPGGNEGDLLSISYPQEAGQPPAAGPVTFTYSTGSLDLRLNGNLLSATDGAGRLLGAFTYSAEADPLHIDYDSCASAERFKTGHVSLIKRQLRPGGGYTIIEVDEIGRVTEIDFDVIHRDLATRQYTGFSIPNVPVTSNENRPTGKLRANDPDFFETTYSYNSDSLCTRLTHPDGSQEITTYDRDFRRDCPVREAGNPRVMKLRTPLGEERTVSCDYLPGFGTFEGIRRPRDISNSRVLSDPKIKGEQGSILVITTTNKMASPDGGITAMDDWESPVVRMVNAHGQVTTCSYDAAGNLLGITSPVPGRGSLYEYNPLGQLTSATTLNGPGPSFTDTCTYDPATSFFSSVVCDSAGLNLTTTWERDPLGRVNRVIDPRGNDQLCSYNALDQIVGIQSAPMPQRVVTSFHYDAAGSLARCDVEHRGADGQLVSANTAYSSFLVYDNHGLLVRTAEEERPVDASGVLNPSSLGIENFAVCDITLNDAGECVRLSTPAACRAQADDLISDFTYDERGFLHLTHEGGEGNPDGLVTARDYNLYGAIPQRRTISGQGITTVESFTYDGFQRPLTETDPMGNVCSYEYDNQGYVTCSVFGEVNDVPGSANNVMLSRFRAKSLNSSVPYDATTTSSGGTYRKKWQVGQPVYGNITFETSLMKAKEKANRTKCGNNLRVICGDPFFGVETEDETVTEDRFTPGGAITQEVTTIDRSPVGLVQQISRNGDLLESFSYDTAGRHTGYFCGETSHFRTLNPNGGVTSYTRTDNCPSDPAQTKTFTVSHVIDAAGRINQTTDGTGNVSSCDYDSLHRPVSFTEPGGLVTRCDYDGETPAGPFSEQISADALTAGTFVVLSRSLVRSGEFRSSADSYGHTTFHSNDSLGRMTRFDYPDGTFKTRGHVHVNIGTIGHVDHGKTVMNYNLNSQLVSSLTTSDPLVAPVSSTPERTFTYNGLGHCTSISQGVHVIGCAYDSLGNLITETQNGRTVTSTYSHRGRSSVTYPTGQMFAENRDALGKLLSISELPALVPAAPPIVIHRYAGSRIIHSTGANGTVTTRQYRGDGEAALSGGADFTFDACVKVSVSDLSFNSIRRDKNQMLLGKQMAFASVANPPTRNQTFTRNRQGHVTACTTRVREVIGGPFVFNEVSYLLDLEGRRLSSSGGPNPGLYTQSASFPPGDQQMGQYSTWPRGLLEWDENGNLISMATATGTLSLVHNVEGQLTSVRRDGVPVISYAYDPIGRCISRDPEIGPAATFIYDGDVCIQELGEDGQPDLTHVFADGSHQRISTRSGSRFYLHKSLDCAVNRWKAPELNSNSDRVALITDTAGVVVERFDCDDAGKPIFLDPAGLPTGAAESTIPLRWMAPECSWEQEIGMFHCPGGFYSPDLGIDVSASKIKIGPPKSGHEYVGHVTLIR